MCQSDCGVAMVIIFFHVGTQHEEFKDPVVYLLGWTGATDKHLAKYSEIYEKEGFITLRYITPSHVPFSSGKPSLGFYCP